MPGRATTIVGGGVAVFVAVFAVALVLLMRGTPTPAQPVGRSSPLTASPSPAASPSPSTEPPPTPIPSPEPSPSPSPLVFGDLNVHPGDQGLAYAPKQFTVTGGTPPYAWSLTSGTLPPGLALSGDGILSGTPTALGNFVFSIGVTDSGGSGSAATLTLNVAALPSITPICAQSCTVEAGCQDVCGGFGMLNGGSAPFRFAVNGQLPAGTTLIGLSLGGTFGDPAGGKTQAYSFTVQLTDAAGATATVTANFNVNPHIVLARQSLPEAAPGQSYNETVLYGNAWGRPSFTVEGTLPPGIGVSLDQGDVRISGTIPRTATPALYTFKITLTDQALCGAGPTNCSAGQTYSIAVAPPPPTPS